MFHNVHEVELVGSVCSIPPGFFTRSVGYWGENVEISFEALSAVPTFRVGTYVFCITVLEVRFSYVSIIPPLAHPAGHTLWKRPPRPAWRLAHRGHSGIITVTMGPWPIASQGLVLARNGVFTGLWWKNKNKDCVCVMVSCFLLKRTRDIYLFILFLVLRFVDRWCLKPTSIVGK